MAVLPRAAEAIRRWRQDPLAFVREELRAEPDHWQADALNKFADPTKQRISLQACAGPGKTAVEAWCGLNFLLCQGDMGEHPKGAGVSITGDNLKDNLWPEFAKWIERSEILKQAFAWTSERVFARDHPETWFLSARSWAKSANADEQGRTLSGLHSKYVLYIIDESGDITPAILKSAEQGLSNCAFGKIIQAGNPTSHNGILYLASTSQRHLWEVIRITGDPLDPKRSSRIDKAWAQQQIDLYGRDDPWVMAYILSQFPASGINTLLAPEEVERAMSRHLREDEYSFAQKRMGIDAARFGDDPWVIFPRQGLAAFRPVEMRGPRSNDVAARVAAGKVKWGSELEFFDGTGGYASGAIDAYIQAGYSPYEVNFSGKATDARYFNKRSEMWFCMADWIKRGGTLPKDAQLARELTTPTYTFHNGKFRLEEKDQIKKRLGTSTNKADALALTFAIEELPAQMMLDGRLVDTRPAKADSDYDPLSAARMEAVGA